jgi:hypothetical protein
MPSKSAFFEIATSAFCTRSAGNNTGQSGHSTKKTAELNLTKSEDFRNKKNSELADDIRCVEKCRWGRGEKMHGNKSE